MSEQSNDWTPEQIIDLLAERDGNPIVLTNHREIPYVLAEWKYSDNHREKSNFLIFDHHWLIQIKHDIIFCDRVVYLTFRE